ncbi:MAG: hypothetical protein OQL27_06460 [Sedimenticola sp.]|nr:hypothetical protein [Sedimenticola sp.]
MKERVSEFPDRPTVTRGGEALVKASEPSRKGKSSSRLGRLIAFGFVLFWLYSSGLFQQIPAWVTEGYNELLRIWLPADGPRPARTPIKREPAKRAERIENVATQKIPAQVVTPEPIKRAKDGLDMPVSIGRGFAPVGFKIGARSQTLSFSGRPGSLHRRLPEFQGPSQKFGSIDLSNGRRHAFVLDTDPKGYQLYVDLNRNGDLTDDGAPLPNRGKGRFANRLRLPLESVSGIPQLKGDLELWVYTNDQSWRKDSMRFYNRTQLVGQLLIKGKRYTAYLADNRVIDGDYQNDGISIDINGDGKIEARTEYFSPGDQITLNGEKIRFNVTR